MNDVSGVGLVIQVISKNDPREAVGKVLEELHKDLAEIQKAKEEKIGKEKVQLEKIEQKIKDAISALKGKDITAAISSAMSLLESIQDVDPQKYSLVEGEVKKLQNLAERAERLTRQSTVVTGSGVIV